MADEKKCFVMEHPNLMPGWACCQCKTYCANWRDECKFCGHIRCYYPKVIIDSTEEEDTDLPATIIDLVGEPIDKKLLN